MKKVPNSLISCALKDKILQQAIDRICHPVSFFLISFACPEHVRHGT
jgi:hypothetical protein